MRRCVVGLSGFSQIPLRALEGRPERLGHMTPTTLIITNAVLGAVIAFALLMLLLHGVHSDRRHRLVRAAELRALPARDRDRIAA